MINSNPACTESQLQELYKVLYLPESQESWAVDYIAEDSGIQQLL